MFLTDEMNQPGIYAFRFYIMGKPWVVTIDDYLPFIEDPLTGQPKLFLGRTGSRDVQPGALWSVLLEKAWAKLKGSYTNANIGFT